ncbi:hypothetical protein ACSSV8_003976 [Roseovarius sp. MBR-79]
MRITEWNTRKNGDVEVANNRSLQQVSMTIEIFYEMVNHNITSANFWPAIFNHTYPCGWWWKCSSRWAR